MFGYQINGGRRSLKYIMRNYTGEIKAGREITVNLKKTCREHFAKAFGNKLENLNDLLIFQGQYHLSKLAP